MIPRIPRSGRLSAPSAFAALIKPWGPGAAELFRYVRDEVQYEFKGKFDPEPYVASNILSGGKGFFVQKALQLCALGRAAGIPSALVLCDVRDQSLSLKTVEAMGLNILNRH